MLVTAKKSVSSWISRIARSGCPETTCRNARIHGLTTAVRETGLDQRRPELVTKSIRTIVRELDEDKEMPAAVRAYAGQCSACPEKNPTQHLFPVEDLLSSLDFGETMEIQNRVLKKCAIPWL